MKEALILVLLFFTKHVYATKPCSPHPCFKNNKFDLNRCARAAKWVAVGEIKNVKHKIKIDSPTKKDFAQFVFKVELVEKGSLNGIEELPLKVGWCKNRKEVPKDYKGKRYRFFGVSEVEYLHFHEFKTD